ncbi:MAG TPA: hypothetical protein VMT50_06055 [Steroidobacteraceae bacterium]|nr:hypothetical protein [Steroidobacteraceae bacterium]
MKILIRIGVASALLFAATTTFAAGPAVDEAVQRDVNQQTRIEQGLQSGQLSTKEAGTLEKQQQKIDRTEARDMKNGPLTKQEQAHINNMQNRSSAEIYADKHNGVTGNPTSASSQRMQADVQRNINQQSRIEQGAQSGALNDKQVGSLEKGQAHVAGKEAAVAANGHVSAHEQARIQKSENHQSKRIHHKKEA